MVFEHDKALRDSGGTVNSYGANTGVCERCGQSSKSQNQVIIKDHLRSHLEGPPLSVGYIRVSTRSQATDRQTQQLDAVCDEMHIEYVSAVADARPVFEAVLSDLRDGDTFVVLDLDRAFRSSVDAILTAEALRERGVKFRILSLQVDTNTPEGELFYTLLACFAQFERKLLSRRTKEGLAAAKKRGVQLGRPAKLTDSQVDEAFAEMVKTESSYQEMARKSGVSRVTLQRAFRRLGLTD